MMGRAALLAFLALTSTNAFAPLTGHPRAQIALWATQEQAVDISVPYDAAARLAYDQWREQYQKGDFDDTRFAKFKANYVAITVANVSAKKVAREKGEEPSLLSLNEYGDCSEEEYAAAQKSGKSATTTGDVLSKAVEAVESQSAASTALGDAATALAEEEEKLAKKLGYDSVEELEVAMDTMEGIAEDGSDLVDGLAREARVRSVYLEWCKENEKEPDEARFPTFFSNFLAMEDYAKESGKEMTLNAYADCTEEEYLVATSVEEEDVVAIAEAAIAQSEAAIAQADAKKEEEAAKLKAEAEAKKKADAEAKAKKEAETKAKQEAAAIANTSLVEERAARQAAQAKAQDLVAEENEAAAIAAAREMVGREAAQIAQRRAIDAKAAEIARKKAKEFEDKQRALASKQAAAKEKAAPKTQASKFNLPNFGSMFQKTPAPAPAKKETTKIEVELPDLGSVFKAPAPAPAKKEAPKIDLPGLRSVFKAPSPAPKPAAKKPVAKKPVVSTSEPLTEAFSSLFASLKTTPSAKVAPKPVAKKPVVATPKPVAKKSVVSTADPVTEAFSSLFGSLKTTSAPKVAPKSSPTPTPVPAAKKEPFSFFGGAKPKKPEPKPEPAPAPAPVPKPAFSFFGSPPPAPKPVPKLVSPPAPKPLSFFGSPAPKKAAPAPAPAPAPKPSFSFFGGNPAGSTSAPTKKAPAAKKAPVKQARGTIAIPKKATSNNFGFAFGGAASKKETETKDDIPILSQFTQNADGSLTGRVSNSKNFKNGTKITTSPVPRGSQAGQIVKTSSGSKYRLK